MVKWIKNSKGRVSGSLKGISYNKKEGTYIAYLTVFLNRKDESNNKSSRVYIGTYKSLKEAKKKRVEYILSLL